MKPYFPFGCKIIPQWKIFHFHTVSQYAHIDIHDFYICVIAYLVGVIISQLSTVLDAILKKQAVVIHEQAKLTLMHACMHAEWQTSKKRPSFCVLSYAKYIYIDILQQKDNSLALNKQENW